MEQLRLSLTQGDKVKIDGLGTFHITLSSEGTEKEKEMCIRDRYQVFALKIDVTRSSFLHIGYNLQNFQTPKDVYKRQYQMTHER